MREKMEVAGLPKTRILLPESFLKFRFNLNTYLMSYDQDIFQQNLKVYNIYEVVGFILINKKFV